jgi:hypothetical protein
MKGIQKIRTLLLIITCVSSGAFVRCQDESRKVLIHYMGWYGQGTYGRHWIYGHVHNPLIGPYDSRKESTITYHILLSLASGIDGLVINVKDDYDKECLDAVIHTMKYLCSLDRGHFKFSLSISYDDQGMSDVTTAKDNFAYLRDHILTDSIDFLNFKGKPAIFIFNYPGQYLTAQDYDSALTTIFGSEKPELIWNQYEADALCRVNSFYPWVGPSAAGWDKTSGLEWGHDYLNWFYPTVNTNGAALDFICGGVWPGFDDRPNTAWGEDRWMDRQDGYVYNQTWAIMNHYSGNLPVQFAVIQTWNDWNEGTEIEPAEGTGYRYLQLSVNNINTFKDTTISNDTVKFEAAGKIYRAHKLLEGDTTYYRQFHVGLETAITLFLQQKYREADSLAGAIRNSITGIQERSFSAVMSMEVIPNPVTGHNAEIRFASWPGMKISIILYNSYGHEISVVFSGRASDTEEEINLDTSGIPAGVYYIILHSDFSTLISKIIIGEGS